MAKCTKCGKEIKEGSKFCRNCGNRVELKCTKCGQEIHEDSKFCKNCGNLVENNNKEETPVKGRFILCPDCGKEISEGSSFCPHCKVLLTNTIPTTGNVYNTYRCPNCGSDRITKSEMYKQKTQGYGCLLWLIIFILCPLLFLLFLGMIGFSIYKVATSPLFMIIFVGLLILLILKNRNQYICERCGHRFRMN